MRYTHRKRLIKICDSLKYTRSEITNIGNCDRDIHNRTPMH